MATDNPGKIQNIPGFSKANKLEWKRRALLFSVFLTLSVIIWLLNALSKPYTTEIEYPITYSRFPENKILVSELPENLTLKVSAHGYTLMNYKLINRPVPINFQVSSFAMNRSSTDSSMFYLLTRYAREQVDKQLPTELQLLEISPDSLIFQFATKIQKKLPVIPDVVFDLEKGFTVKGDVKITPDSILLTGPDIFLDTMTSVKAERLELGSLDRSYQGVLAINNLKGFTYDFDEVDCQIALEKITEVKLQVPIQVIGLPDSMRIQTFPAKANVSGKVGLSNYERVVPDAFWIEIDYKEIAENMSRLQVHMRTSPDFLYGIDFYPQTVEYILSVK